MSVTSWSAIFFSSITVTVAGTSLTSVGMRVAVTVIVESCCSASFLSCALAGNATARAQRLIPTPKTPRMPRNLSANASDSQLRVG